MPTTVIKGNIFTSSAQTLVNTVNCEGAMGAGIALEYRLRYPDMYQRYVSLCQAGKIDIGLLWIYRTDNRLILNFPTKRHWKDESKLEYLEKGLKKFCETYKARGITSIAFPLLGSDKGGIAPTDSLRVMKKYLEPLDIDITIYQYDPHAQDDLYDQLKEWVYRKGPTQAAKEADLRIHYMDKVLQAFDDPDLCQINQLLKVKGIGLATVEKLFHATRRSTDASAEGETRELF